jgi:hypothetical protein
MKKPNHLVISDPQRKPDQTHEDMTALGNLVVDRRPEVIVCVGDWWDMPSLCSYDDGTMYMENQRYLADVEAGNEAMEAFLAPMEDFNRRAKKKYKPRMVFLIGNHEERIERFGADNPKLEDVLTYDDLALDAWEVHDFLEVVEIDGVYYSHYFTNHMNKPIGGTVFNRLNKLKFSFTQGHQQLYAHTKEYLNDGRVLNGLITGSFYQYKERYMGPQASNHWRGVVYKHDVHNGDYDIEMIHISRLMREYGE